MHTCTASDAITCRSLPETKIVHPDLCSCRLITHKHRVGENGDWESANGVMTPDNRTHFQIQGLQPYTVYSFRVLAVNAIGTSFPSKESFYMLTLREIPDGKADIRKAGNASSTSITIHWNPPDRERLNGEFLGYQIKYWPRDRTEDVGEISLRDPDLRVSLQSRLQQQQQQRL